MGWNSTVVDNKMSTKDLRDFVIDEFYYDINIVYRSNRGNNIYLAYTHKLYPDQIGGCCVKVQQWKHHGYWEAANKDISLNPYDCPDCPKKIIRFLEPVLSEEEKQDWKKHWEKQRMRSQLQDGDTVKLRHAYTYAGITTDTFMIDKTHKCWRFPHPSCPRNALQPPSGWKQNIIAVNGKEVWHQEI